LAASFRAGRGPAGESWRIEGPARMDGVVQPPGDKSIAHRSVVVAALGRGSSVLHDLPAGEDVGRTLSAMRALGASARRDGRTCVIAGAGLHGLHRARAAIDCGNSGTTMRLLAGVLAAQPFASRLTGDASLLARPMQRVASPLTAMGARIACEGRAGRPPLRIEPAVEPLHGVTHKVAVDSAQVRSAILFAALYAGGPTRIVPAGAARDHTERLLAACGVRVVSDAGGLLLVPTHARGWGALEAHIPGDVSSAAFWVGLAAAVPQARLRVERVGLNPGRARFLELLRAAGARIAVHVLGESNREPWGTIEVEGGGFGALALGGADAVRCIDEIPALAAAAALAGARMRVRGAADLRSKESDRIAGTVRVLTAFGARARARRDGFDLESAPRLRAARVASGGDHRLAMMAAILALGVAGESHIEDVGCVRTSYPEFGADLRRLCGV
jgi:3-phosphoshikimate 1-carboxyvinyltransferase